MSDVLVQLKWQNPDRRYRTKRRPAANGANKFAAAKVLVG
jgi:hypothetical protein